ncbi:MAG: PadR family transcriptional regulator [Sandaracinaceae bacterium]
MLPTYVLTLLSTGARYGTEIRDAMAEMSYGEWRPSPGSLYPLLKRLEAEGLIEGDWQRGSAAAKRVYSLTPKGTRELPVLQDQLVADLRQTKEVISRHLEALEQLRAGDASQVAQAHPSLASPESSK